ncbi:MAG TPA: transglycosylase SLT domain-containing protein [Kofleriaceae bacterium]|nr:transglycosylase SLT domain-containing protein [Kofleriaceae bacterium]
MSAALSVCLSCSGGSGPTGSHTQTPADGAPSGERAGGASAPQRGETTAETEAEATAAAAAAAAKIPAPPPVVEPEPAPPPAPEAGAVALSESKAAPYFADGAAAAAAARFALEDWKEARAGFAKLLRGKPRPKRDERARIELMVALCDAHLDHHEQAARGFVHALEALPELADWLHFQAARSFFLAHDAEQALAHARKVAPDSISGQDAELLAGDVVRGRGDAGAIAAHYRKYLADHPGGIRLSEARFRLAEALEHQEDGAGEALTIYRKLTISAPLSRWASDARQRLRALLAGRESTERASVEQLSAAELIERGMVYFDNMRNQDSEADFTAALSAPGLDAEMRCVAAFHRAQSVFKQRDRTRAAPLFDAATAACEGTKNLDLRVKAPYQAGRSYSNIGEHEAALERYRRAERAAGPEHSFADDARLRQAEEQDELGDQAQVTELLSSLPRLYPKGDMRAEAMWRLAWRAYKLRRYDEALIWLRKQIQLVPHDDNYWAEGQAQYWIGRSEERKGRAAEAAAAYEDTVRTYPLSYYALLALNRLRERHADRFRAVVAEVAAQPDGWTPDKPAFEFRPRALYASPAFARALEFLRLGLGSEAETELRRLGLAAPGGKSRVDDPDRQDMLWAMAFLYDGAGRYGTSHWVTRWQITDFKRRWPTGPNRKRWEISYPRAWWNLLERNARKQGYPPELLISFVREESAFDPLLESFANAIGLTQMIAPTAKRFARGTGISVSRETLRDPEKNVTIGSRFLAFLVDKFDRRIGLVVPSYNAGEAATTRWLKERGDWPMDEFSEEIPYDETRNYSKRVIATYFAYSYLKDGTIPEMPNDIPDSLRRHGGRVSAERSSGKRMKGR